PVPLVSSGTLLWHRRSPDVSLTSVPWLGTSCLGSSVSPLGPVPLVSSGTLLWHRRSPDAMLTSVPWLGTSC
ncbi:hypothetical protein LEMLEM_LOCUS14866, partial [Lemmus lemmus]